MHHSLNQTELPFIIVCETKHIKINHGRNNIHYLGNCTLYPLYSIRITNKFLLSTKGNIKILYTFPIILEKTHLFLLHFCHFCCLLLLSFFSFFHTTAFHRNSRRRRGRGGGRHIDKYLHASTAQSFHSFAHRFHSFAKKTRALFYSKQMTFKTKRDERREKKKNKGARRRTMDESITRDEASVHTHTFRFNDHIPPVEEKKKKKKTRVPLFLVSFSPSLPLFFRLHCVHTREETKERRFSRLERPLRLSVGFDIADLPLLLFILTNDSQMQLHRVLCPCRKRPHKRALSYPLDSRRKAASRIPDA